MTREIIGQDYGFGFPATIKHTSRRTTGAVILISNPVQPGTQRGPLWIRTPMFVSSGRRGCGCGNWWALRAIMNTMSEVAENPVVLDDVVRRIAERFSPDKIILFGSRARGDAGPDSDIDLLVLFSDVADPNKRAAELYASLVDFPRPMDIVVSTSSRFERYRNVVNTVYWPASREGRVLYERAA
jgi:predicted nucleotidyltransferase